MMTARGSPIVRYVLAAAAIVIVVFGLKYSSDVLAPIFFAATLAILFTPMLRWLEKRGLPSGLALLVMVLGLGGFIVFMVIILTASVQQLALRLPVYQELLQKRIDALGTVLGNIGIDVIATKFQTSLQTGNNFVILLGSYTKQIQKQYRIQAMSNLLSAVAILVELLLFRVDFAIVWGFLAFILGFIPNVGLLLACTPAIIIALILYGWGTALAILAIGIALNAAMDNAVTPRIMGKGLNLPVLLVFLSFLFWSWVFGFIGALLAIPATLFVKTLLQGRQETRFLVALLSGKVDSEATITISHDGQNENNAVEGQSDTNDARDAAVIADAKEAPPNEE